MEPMGVCNGRFFSSYRYLSERKGIRSVSVTSVRNPDRNSANRCGDEATARRNRFCRLAANLWSFVPMKSPLLLHDSTKDNRSLCFSSCRDAANVDFGCVSLFTHHQPFFFDLLIFFFKYFFPNNEVISKKKVKKLDQGTHYWKA